MSDVTVLCVTYGATDIVAGTLTGLARSTVGSPPRVVVADNGSPPAEVTVIEEVAVGCGFDFLRVEDRPDQPVDAWRPEGGSSRRHASTLDWLAARVDTPWFVTIDSDIEFAGSSWLQPMLAHADSIQADAVGEYESAVGRYHPRLAVHLALWRTETFRALDGTFQGATVIDDPEEAERWRRRPASFRLTVEDMERFPSARWYTTGALYFARLRAAGRTWSTTPVSVRSGYRHLGHASWA